MQLLLKEMQQKTAFLLLKHAIQLNLNYNLNSKKV